MSYVLSFSLVKPGIVIQLGKNGQSKIVIAVYQIDRESKIPKMITNYLERKRK